MDPWGGVAVASVNSENFEDNFSLEGSSQPQVTSYKLDDSAQYLALLEKRLKTVRAKNNIVENLAAYRADCIERLLRDGASLDPVIGDTDQEALIGKELQ